MHRSIRTALIAAGAATAMLVTGCSTTVTGSPAAVGASSAAPSAPATGDPVAWINGVCGSLLGFVRTVSAPPAIDSSSPQKAVTGLSTYLGTAVTAIDKATTDIKGAGPSPVEGGDKAVTTITDALGKARTSFQSAKTKIDAVNTSDLSQVATALPEALAPLQDLSTLTNTSTDLQSTPELDKAAQQAPNCRALQTTGG
ncbi:hypothetical protein [Pseudonocardia sp. 73-21]|uniref:hypothetical protein n=1 Tax=Pseudonocardia sp. 73-21 TaxID=1895809 RepID=UPI000964349D|nr:hypothetical protein [Pseudonocardia sp. 73-21]OJY37726.1 MAG: hypothetical protein BGP03_17885 [Pseudonocardia sp. 73-21]